MRGRLLGGALVLGLAAVAVLAAEGDAKTVEPAIAAEVAVQVSETCSADPADEAVSLPQDGRVEAGGGCSITISPCGAVPCFTDADSCTSWTDTGSQTCTIRFGANSSPQTCEAGKTWHYRTCDCVGAGGPCPQPSGVFASCL